MCLIKRLVDLVYIECDDNLNKNIYFYGFFVFWK